LATEFWSFIDENKPAVPRISTLEKKVLNYIKNRNYKIKMSECARELKITTQKVKTAIESLTKKGFINK
jgi:DNA-binding MarR family transcriptional regulator